MSEPHQRSAASITGGVQIADKAVIGGIERYCRQLGIELTVD